ncbi:MAG TPA: GNAT family N-acetyltransferase [Solirubrobacteraceae bacterium]|nr:GNAT family N-acetyltransferase [Solirubrobacteraceae bacterium]
MRIERLQPSDLDALAELEAAVLAHDGTPLKLEWAYIREQRTVASLVIRDRDSAAGRLIAYLGVYPFGGPPEAELVGMVHPGHRRHGLAGALLEEAKHICAARGLSHRLLVVPRAGVAAASFIASRRVTREHSEYSMRLTGTPVRVPEDPDTLVRDATPEDRADRIRILTAGFGPPPEDMLDALHPDGLRTVMIEHAGAVVGTASLRLVGDLGGIYGFAIDPEHRGRGIGVDALGRFCSLLGEAGASAVRLEVAVENERALHIYTATGFAPLSTEDYYRLEE